MNLGIRRAQVVPLTVGSSLLKMTYNMTRELSSLQNEHPRQGSCFPIVFIHESPVERNRESSRHRPHLADTVLESLSCAGSMFLMFCTVEHKGVRETSTQTGPDSPNTSPRNNPSDLSRGCWNTLSSWFRTLGESPNRGPSASRLNMKSRWPWLGGHRLERPPVRQEFAGSIPGQDTELG